MRVPCVYIMTNRRNGTLYTGVTSDPIRRVAEHKKGAIPGFTRRYHLDRLVYFELYDSMTDAIAREHAIKHWRRAWKLSLVDDANPNWTDLYNEICGINPADPSDPHSSS